MTAPTRRRFLLAAAFAVGGVGRAADREPAVVGVAWSPDGSRHAFGRGEAVCVHDARREVLALEAGGKGVTAVAYGPMIAAGCWSGAVRLWDADGKPRPSLAGHRETVTALAFRPDGKRLATASADDTLRLWDTATGKLLRTWEAGNEYDFTSVAWSPDGKRLAAGDGESGATVWDAADGEELLSILGHEATVTAVAFTPDGRGIVTGSRDDTARVWDARTGKALRVLDHPDDVTCVAVSPDGTLIATGCEDGTARLWDAATGKERRSRRGKPIVSLAFRPDGKAVAVAGGASVAFWSAED